MNIINIKSFFIILTFLLIISFTEISLQLTYNPKSIDQTNYFVDLHNSNFGESCMFESTILPHPNFTFTYKGDGECYSTGINNFGFSNKYSVSTEKNLDYFDIAVVGGSVADIMFHHFIANDSYLEHQLNKNFISPNKKPFRVHNFALGANNFPTQINILNYFGQFIDGFIAIDGYNEFLTVMEIGRIDMPPLIPFYLSTILHLTDKLDGLKNLYAFKVYLKKSPLQNSMLIRLFYDCWLKYQYSKLDKVIEMFKETQNSYKVKADNQEQIFQLNYKRYQYYIDSYRNISKNLNVKYAHFIQPIISLEKNLTSDEEKVKSVSFSPYYKEFAEIINSLDTEKYNTYSLIDVFNKSNNTIYMDQVHYKFEKNNYSSGYQILINRILDTIQNKWQLKKK